MCCCVLCRFRLLDVSSHHFADIFDGYTRNPKVVPGNLNPNAAYNAVHAISQVSTTMCRDGTLAPGVHSSGPCDRTVLVNMVNGN